LCRKRWRKPLRRSLPNAVRAGAQWRIEDIVYDRGEAYAAFHRRRAKH
jgi:hypothetical protein